MHYKRSVLALFLSIVLMVFLLSACSNNNTECKLSELKDDKLIQYITDSKIAIPEDIDIDTIRGMIIELEIIWIIQHPLWATLWLQTYTKISAIWLLNMNRAKNDSPVALFSSRYDLII